MNLGATCYMNAIIQCLRYIEYGACPRLVNITGPNVEKENTPTSLEIASEYYKLFKCLWEAAWRTNKNPKSFHGIMASKYNVYANVKEQQDAHEFLTHVIENVAKADPSMANRFTGTSKSSRKCHRCETVVEKLETFTVLT